MTDMREYAARIARVRELHHFVVDEIETREGPEDVQPVPVPIETVLRLTRARAEKAEAAIQRVREVADRVARYHGVAPHWAANSPAATPFLSPPPWDGLPCIKPRDIYRALDGDSDG